MKLFRILQRRLEPLALFGQNMNDDRVVAGLGKFQSANQEWQVVTVDRTEVPHAHLLENQAAAVPATPVGFRGAWGRVQSHLRQRALEALFGLMRQLKSHFALGKTSEKSLEVLCQLVVGRMGDELIEIARNRPDVLGDAPLVIIEDSDETLSGLSDVV